MKSKRRDLGQYRKNKGLTSLRTSKNQKGSNPMSKSLKLGGLSNLRKSGKGSELTKESPSVHNKRTRTNNLKKMKEKDRRMRGNERRIYHRGKSGSNNRRRRKWPVHNEWKD